MTCRAKISLILARLTVDTTAGLKADVRSRERKRFFNDD